MTNDIDELKERVKKMEKRIVALEKALTPSIDDDALLCTSTRRVD